MIVAVVVRDEYILAALRGARVYYWCEALDFKEEHSWPDVLRGKSVEARAVVREDNAPRSRPITRQTIALGVTALAESYPERFARLVKGYADGEDGDVLLQLVVFGEVVYG